jgi:signal peptidase II
LPDSKPADTAASAKRPSARILVMLAAIAVLVFGVDQAAKALVLESMRVGQVIPVLGELLQLHLVKNSGAAFSLLSGSTWVFAIASSVVTVVIVLFAGRIRSRGWAVVFGMLLGGTTGNLFDRLFREPGFGVGHVVDFIQIYLFPAIFNIADIAITSAMALFIILTIRGVSLDGTRAPHRPKTETLDAE